jgi:hypothetical protein
VGLAKAEALAQSRGVSIQTCCGDLAAFHPAPQSVDLVVAIWMHLPPPLRAQALARAVAALRPGGHLILEAYTPRQLELLCEPEDLRVELAGLELLVLQERRRWIEEGPYPHGDSAVAQVIGRKLR